MLATEIVIENNRNEAFLRLELETLSRTFEIWEKYYTEMKEERISKAKDANEVAEITRDFEKVMLELRNHCEKQKEKIVLKYTELEINLQKEVG